MWSRVRAHLAIATATAVYAIGWSGFGLAIGSPLAIPYFLEMVALGWLVIRLDLRSPFSRSTLVGLSLWGFLHMIGGMLPVGDSTLYDAWLLPVLRWDQLVHAVGFAFGGLAMFEAFLPWMRIPPSPAGAAWVAFMGSAAVGAINETVEFVAARVLPFANIGDEINTGLDLVANAVGGVVAAWFARRRTRRDGAVTEPPG